MNTQQQIECILARVNQLEKEVEFLKSKSTLNYAGERTVDCVSLHRLPVPDEQNQTQPFGIPRPIIS